MMSTFPTKDSIVLLLRNEVSPLLRSHGGDISLVEVSQPVVKVRFTGACLHCSFASETLENVVQQTLRKAFNNPEIQVIMSNELNRQLLNEARRILHNNKYRK